MKRFWLLALLTAGLLTVALSSPASAAKMNDETNDSSMDQSQAMDDINSAMGTMSAHMNDIDKKLKLNVGGDVRLRYAFINQAASAAGATIFDSSRGRYRARFGATMTSGDFTGRFRVATGSTASPWSQNNTFDTAFTNPSVLIDTANITWEPSFADHMLFVTAGKMANPLTKTSISWDPDIQPEGIELEFRKSDFTFRATYFELQNLFAYSATNNIDLFMDNLQAEYSAKIDKDTTLGIMAGFEYIPNATTLMYSGLAAAAALNKNPIESFGGVLDSAGQVREWDNVEGLLYFKHKIGDVPLKWYLHITDNTNGTNLPNFAGGPSIIAGGVTAVAGNGTYQTQFTNQYAWLFGVDIGTLSNPGDFMGTIYAASLDPNCTLPFLTDDDPGETNRQYIFGALSALLDPGVTFKLSQWAVQREYYAIPNVGGASSLGGSSQNPEFITYADCIVNL